MFDSMSLKFQCSNRSIALPICNTLTLDVWQQYSGNECKSICQFEFSRGQYIKTVHHSFFFRWHSTHTSTQAYTHTYCVLYYTIWAGAHNIISVHTGATNNNCKSTTFICLCRCFFCLEACIVAVGTLNSSILF